jgi:hypothetical protein
MMAAAKRANVGAAVELDRARHRPAPSPSPIGVLSAYVDSLAERITRLESQIGDAESIAAYAAERVDMIHCERCA